MKAFFGKETEGLSPYYRSFKVAPTPSFPASSTPLAEEMTVQEIYLKEALAKIEQFVCFRRACRRGLILSLSGPNRTAQTFFWGVGFPSKLDKEPKKVKAFLVGLSIGSHNRFDRL